jgi:hypothetical protein
MKTCETCRFWVRPERAEYLDVIAPWDEELSGPKQMPWEVRQCCCPKIVKFERTVVRDGATLMDGSHYFAALYPGPDFGCVNHEEL